MADIRYVCLSDLHLGAQNSLLSTLDAESFGVDVNEPSPVLVGLFDCLDSLISTNEGKRPPTLILNGDVLEMGLAEQNVAAMAFQLFAKLAFDRHDGLFEDAVLFVPGNHDHHVWEAAREHDYESYIRSRGAGERLEPPRHTTPMRIDGDADPVDSDFLNSLLRRQFPKKDLGVGTVYPNMALAGPDSSRVVVFSHGHFVERTYMLVSEFEDMLFPARREGDVRDDIAEWEADNFAWIEFLGSTLGRSGQAGEALRLIYTALESEEVVNTLGANLARGLTARTPGPSRLHGAEAKVLKRPLSFMIRRANKFERTLPDVLLSEDAEEGLHTYLERPVRHQLELEFGHVPDDVTFVFGHTHKPFSNQVRVESYPAPVGVYNTGGWVVDHLEPQPIQGAAMVLLDEELDAVSLRLYNDLSDPSGYRVSLERADGRADTPLSKKLCQLVDPERHPWRGFSESAGSVIQQRRRDLEHLMRVAQRQAGEEPQEWAGGVGTRPS